ncbi:MAG TPA: adenylate kinase [Candidatus Polarisedimenticolia bacterium]|jgi:adenylate kinase|nr:adenylate kinase [Candidatus Polarisedimenticolia bacterium]
MADAERGGIRLVLFGAPGVGKGTQAERLSRWFGVPHVSTGDMLRAAIREGTPLGLRARAVVERGELVPDELVSALVADRLAQDDVRAGFILDGYPRTVRQAEDLDRALGPGEIDRVVNLEVPAAEIVERLAGRRNCASCGAVYHVRFQPPKATDRCDRCGGALTARPDDAPEVVQGRLRVYEAQTAPVLSFYRDRALLADVDGRGRPDEITERIVRAVAGNGGR